MKSLRIIITICFGLSQFKGLSQKLADPILLWPEEAPGATGTSDEDRPAVIPFLPDAGNRNGTAILVIPGGGFTLRAVDHEGVLVAQWLKAHGITAFLLRYRLKPMYSRVDWLKDGQRGIQFIRAHAKEYHISPDRVGAVGFSAGANLAADLSFNHIPANPNAQDAMDREPTKPDFIIMAYGSAPLPFTDTAALSGFPPTFMFGTAEDAGSMNGMVSLYTGLFRAKVPVEAHFFQNGVHGMGFALGDPVLGEWPKLMYTWIKAGGFLTSKPQLSLTGIVKLDGKPLVRGMVILTPQGQPTAPPVTIYITNTGTGELGRFAVPEHQGPVPGKYKVEIRQDATRWTSNSRDPFMIRMMAKDHDHTLTEEDLMEWTAYTRKRDLSPSIYNQRVFSRKHPSDKNEYIVDLKGGDHLMVEVYSK